MTVVLKHYENLLADRYTWMAGGMASRVEDNRLFFEHHQLVPHLSGVAVDLGAGTGFQSLPLAEKGFRVLAVDVSPTMLRELEVNKKDADIKIVCDDMLNFNRHLAAAAELIVCMGDTLTHLESQEQVEQLLEQIYGGLQTGGKTVLTFRDLTMELEGVDRFIPVRSDDNTIFTCFLEYRPHHVDVHDLIHVREKGAWVLKKSCYQKLRLGMDWVTQLLTALGFRLVVSEKKRGLVTIIAEKKEA